MINKRSLWFLTLFSLILVLSIYYITMPSELLLTTGNNINNKDDAEESTISVEESDILVALRVESDQKMASEIEDLQLVLTNTESSVEEKNKDTRGEEEKLENQVKETYKLDAYVKITDSGINVTVNSSENSNQLANNIMRTIQSNYNDYKYITVKFQK